MDRPEAAIFPFLVVGAGATGLRLRALRDHADSAPLRLFCRGIEVGSLALPGPIAAGTLLDIPVTRLPRVPLPALLRLAAATEGPELAEPWTIATPGMAAALLGAAAPLLEDLRLEHGMLRGTGIERVNGLLEPVLHAIINGTTARAVQVEPPVPLAEGGCAFRFGLALEPTDLTGAGLDITLHAPGLQAPLARFAWAPVLPGAAEARMAELEARLQRLEQAAKSAQAAGQEALDRRFALQQDRIDAFIDAAASLLLDRLAGDAAPAALRALVATTTPEPPAVPPVSAEAARHIRLGPQDAAFDLGWHGAEEDAGGGFRWMTHQGLVRNPAPLQAVAAVTVEIGHLYGAAAPALEASFDAAPCLIAMEQVGPHHFTLRITPPDGAMPCRLLRLQALAGGSPAEDGVSGDARVLSVAVSGVGFEYAA
jgi:hypothetical protein